MCVQVTPKSSEVEVDDLKRQLRIAILNQMHRLLERKEESQSMEVADTTSTDNGFTVLESGQQINHHTKSTCEAPCALHSPIDGPWAEWPRQYWSDDDLAGIYRVCPHGVAHPAVEQAIYLIKQGKAELLSHECCNQCVCMPRATLPDQLFNGKLVPTHPGLYIRVEAQKQASSEPQPQPEPEKNNGTRDPNSWARGYLDMNLRPVIGVPMELYILLTSGMFDDENGHYITEVSGTGDSGFSLECVDECDLRLEKTTSGSWFNSGPSWCPTVEIALLAGWKPSNWDWENGGDDEYGDDDEG